MAVKHLFLALLDQGKLHGYDLKKEFEQLVSNQWPLNFGQVYSTLSRLERDGLIVSEQITQDEKPDKKVYAITKAGKQHYLKWLSSQSPWALFHDELDVKMAAYQFLDKSTALNLLRQYREYILNVLQELDTLANQPSGSLNPLIVTRNVLRAEADLKWVTMMIERWSKQ